MSDVSFTNKPYCTVDDVKALWDRRSTTDDDLIASLIPQAQAAVDLYLGYSFQTDGTVAAPATRTYDGNGASQLLIDRLTSLSTVTIQTYTYGTDAVTGAATRTTNTPTDITAICLLGPANKTPGYILEHVTGAFPLGKRNIVVTGVFGIATIHPLASRATVLQTVHMLMQRDMGYQRVMGTQEQGMKVAEDLCKEAQETVSRLRRTMFRS